MHKEAQGPEPGPHYIHTGMTECMSIKIQASLSKHSNQEVKLQAVQSITVVTRAGSLFW